MGPIFHPGLPQEVVHEDQFPPNLVQKMNALAYHFASKRYERDDGARKKMLKKCVEQLVIVAPGTARVLLPIFLRICDPQAFSGRTTSDAEELALHEDGSLSSSENMKSPIEALTEGGIESYVDEMAPLIAAFLRPGGMSYPAFKIFVESSVFENMFFVLELDSTRIRRDKVEEIVATTYRQCPPARAAIRIRILRLLQKSICVCPCSHRGILSGLRLIVPITNGLRHPISEEWENVLFTHLVPLFASEELVSEHVPVLKTYQQPLLECCRGIIQRLCPEAHFRVCTKFFHETIQLWDRSSSNHCVEMITGFETFLDEIDGEVYDHIAKELHLKIGECIASDNSILASNALRLFDKSSFILLLSRNKQQALHHLLPPLIRDGTLHWCPKVNNRISNALRVLHSAAFHSGTQSDTDSQSMGLSVAQASDQNKERIASICANYLMTLLRISTIEEANKRVTTYFGSLEGLATRKSQMQEEISILREARKDDMTPFPKHVNSHLHFIFGRQIGYGSYSKVMYSKRIEQEIPQGIWKEYATKIVPKSIIKDTNFEAQMAQEIELMKRFQSPFISPLFASFEDDNNLYLVLELCARGDLFAAVFENSGPCSVSVQWAKHGAAEIFSAINYVHSLGYMFGDIKTENILVAGNGHLRLCDFGSCKSTAELAKINKRWADRESVWFKDLIGTLDFLSPEVVSSTSVGIEADIWAFGVVLVQLLCGFLPFTGDNVEALVESILYTTPRLPPLGEGAIPLLLGLLTKDPAIRLNATAIHRHQFFAGTVWETLHQKTPPELLMGYRPNQDMADPKFMNRKYSMLYRGNEKAVMGALPTSGAVQEETTEQTSWEAPEHLSETPWVPLTCTSVARHEGKEKRVSSPGVAQVGNTLGDYCTTVQKPSATRKQSFGMRRRVTERAMTPMPAMAE